MRECEKGLKEGGLAKENDGLDLGTCSGCIQQPRRTIMWWDECPPGSDLLPSMSAKRIRTCLLRLARLKPMRTGTP
jgi:hypothetical protein